MVASMDVNSIPNEFKARDEEKGDVFYIYQRHPWAQRQGMPLDPLNNFGNNNSSHCPNQDPQNYSPQVQNWNHN